MRTIAIIIVSTLLISACKSKASGTNETEPAKRQKDAATEKAPKPIDVAEARALFDKWLATQNSGDFAGYEILFATSFNGIKRAAGKITRYDREAWLADRRRMFKKKMKVEATEVTATTSGADAAVNFTQTWSSGSYQDVGPKRLIMAREGDVLRIVSEEMRESQKSGKLGEWIGRLAGSRVEGAKLPANITAELLKLGSPLAAAERNPRVAFVQKLNATSLVIEVLADPPTGSVGSVDDGTLMLVRHRDGVASATSAASVPGGSETSYHRDIDGDSIGDVLVSYAWDFDDYRSSGWVLALSKLGIVTAIVTSNQHRNDGSNPQTLSIDTTSWCTMTISGRLAIIAAYEWDSSEVDLDTGEASAEEHDEGTTAWVLSEGNAEPTKVFAHWTPGRSAASTAAAGPPNACPGGDAATFTARDSGDGDKRKEHVYRWSGFALTKAEAVSLAKSAKVDPARVALLGPAQQSDAPTRP